MNMIFFHYSEWIRIIPKIKISKRYFIMKSWYPLHPFNLSFDGVLKTPSFDEGGGLLNRPLPPQKKIISKNFLYTKFSRIFLKQ